MFWKIYVVELTETKEKEPIIQLEWGWTARMSEEELENYAEDAPRGKETVLTTLSLAKELRDDLDRIISQYEDGQPNW